MPKNRAVLSLIAWWNVSQSSPRKSAKNSAVSEVIQGLQGRSPLRGIGDRKGASVSTMIRSIGTRRAASCTSLAFLYVTTPVKLIIAPKSRIMRASSALPVKQWKTKRAGSNGLDFKIGMRSPNA